MEHQIDFVLRHVPVELCVPLGGGEKWYLHRVSIVGYATLNVGLLLPLELRVDLDAQDGGISLAPVGGGGISLSGMCDPCQFEPDRALLAVPLTTDGASIAWPIISDCVRGTMKSVDPLLGVNVGEVVQYEGMWYVVSVTANVSRIDDGHPRVVLDRIALLDHRTRSPISPVLPRQPLYSETHRLMLPSLTESTVTAFRLLPSALSAVERSLMLRDFMALHSLPVREDILRRILSRDTPQTLSTFGDAVIKLAVTISIVLCDDGEAFTGLQEKHLTRQSKVTNEFLRDAAIDRGLVSFLLPTSIQIQHCPWYPPGSPEAIQRSMIADVRAGKMAADMCEEVTAAASLSAGGWPLALRFLLQLGVLSATEFTMMARYGTAPVAPPSIDNVSVFFARELLSKTQQATRYQFRDAPGVLAAVTLPPVAVALGIPAAKSANSVLDRMRRNLELTKSHRHLVWIGNAALEYAATAVLHDEGEARLSTKRAQLTLIRARGQRCYQLGLLDWIMLMVQDVSADAVTNAIVHFTANTADIPEGMPLLKKMGEIINVIAALILIDSNFDIAIATSAIRRLLPE